MLFFLVSLLLTTVAAFDKESFVSNGKDAKDGEFPYHVGLGGKLINSDKYINLCSASLISPTIVITAAHCFDYDSYMIDYVVYLGSVQIEDAITKPVHNKTLHEYYDPIMHRNDIALLNIEEATYSDKIRNIALPDISDDNDYQNTIAIASGWGLINAKGEYPSILQYTELKVVSFDECGIKDVLEFEKEKVFCAGDRNGSSLCGGDSGGPLVHKDSITLIGITITKFGSDRCTLRFGNLFTRVTSYRQWILDNAGV